MLIFEYGIVKAGDPSVAGYSGIAMGKADWLRLKSKHSRLSLSLSLQARKYLRRICKRMGIRPVLGYCRDGKPYLVDRPRDSISITHSYPWVGVAYKSEGRCGIDIEMMNRPFPSGALSIFNNLERRFLKQSPRSRTDAFLIWTRKEAFAKAAGLSVFDTVYSNQGDDLFFASRNAGAIGAWRYHSFFPAENCCLTMCEGRHEKSMRGAA